MYIIKNGSKLNKSETFGRLTPFFLLIPHIEWAVKLI